MIFPCRKVWWPVLWGRTLDLFSYERYGDAGALCTAANYFRRASCPPLSANKRVTRGTAPGKCFRDLPCWTDRKYCEFYYDRVAPRDESLREISTIKSRRRASRVRVCAVAGYGVRFVRPYCDYGSFYRRKSRCARARALQTVKSSAPVLWCRIHHLNTCLLVRASSASLRSVLFLSPPFSLLACLRSAGRVTGRDKSRASSRESFWLFRR